jgi:hypothetical protein
MNKSNTSRSNSGIKLLTQSRDLSLSNYSLTTANQLMRTNNFPNIISQKRNLSNTSTGRTSISPGKKPPITGYIRLINTPKCFIPLGKHPTFHKLKKPLSKEDLSTSKNHSKNFSYDSCTKRSEDRRITSSSNNSRGNITTNPNTNTTTNNSNNIKIVNHSNSNKIHSNNKKSNSKGSSSNNIKAVTKVNSGTQITTQLNINNNIWIDNDLNDKEIIVIKPKKIDSPEELHFIQVRFFQDNKSISNKFDY